MNWFDILKILGTKSGYAQLDFDNIVEEDEDNCKRRWQESVNKFKQFDIDSFRYKEIKRRFPSKSKQREFYQLFLGDDEEDSPTVLIEHQAKYDPNVPEEVYCAAIELFENNRKTREYQSEQVPFNETYYFYVTSMDDEEHILIVENGKIVSMLKWHIFGFWDMFDQEAPYVYLSIDNKEYNLVELDKMFREMIL